MYPFLLLRKVTTDMDVALDAYFSRYNLSVGRFTLLSLLNGKSEGMMPSELANSVGVTQATISGLINSLEKAELVTRQTHKKDGRAFVITLTQKGAELVKKITPEYFERVDKMMSEMAAEDKKTMAALMQKLIERIPYISKS
jgi:DNA-binding MarR family transcriptional regulator